MASGETMVHDPLMTNASPMALHAMMPIVAAVHARGAGYRLTRRS